ncbi:hypothetical protein EYF80_062001 [Liparis tanakae]|uniref:Uncharacterized protein n=1 Tax=Liparis tanakae TaxID=230148 RepID=A0A4Z2EHP4_9TELE|nr:hypothetical protein EYF80_062001 [Liparis tanakae]
MQVRSLQDRPPGVRGHTADLQESEVTLQTSRGQRSHCRPPGVRGHTADLQGSGVTLQTSKDICSHLSL